MYILRNLKDSKLFSTVHLGELFMALCYTRTRGFSRTSVLHQNKEVLQNQCDTPEKVCSPDPVCYSKTRGFSRTRVLPQNKGVIQTQGVLNLHSALKNKSLSPPKLLSIFHYFPLNIQNLSGFYPNCLGTSSILRKGSSSVLRLLKQFWIFGLSLE